MPSLHEVRAFFREKRREKSEKIREKEGKIKNPSGVAFASRRVGGAFTLSNRPGTSEKRLPPEGKVAARKG